MIDEAKKALLSAAIEKPSIYDIKVDDSSMLPDGLKDSEIIKITIKPPTMETLAKCATTALNIPESIRESKDIKLEEALEYRNEMAQVLSILAHGKSDDYPSWYVPFFLNNLSGKELYIIFYESMLKLQTDFFLNCFQMMDQNNPMMMKKKTEISDSTPTS